MVADATSAERSPSGRGDSGWDETAAPPRRRRFARAVAMGLATVLLPLLFLADLMRPVVFERHLLEEVAVARAVKEPLFDAADYGCIGLAVVFVVGIGALVVARRGALARKILLAAWSLFLMGALVEVVLESTDRPYVLIPNLSITYHPHPDIMPGISGPSRITTNSLGMRAPEWDAAAYKVLCIGGSTTICTYLDDTEAWPHQLMMTLNGQDPDRRYWVGNVGKSGHDTLHHVMLMQQLPEASQVDCCLVLCGVNDLEHALRTPSDVRERLAASRVFDVGGPFSPIRPYLKQTYLYQWSKALVGRKPPAATMEIEDPKGEVFIQRRQARQRAVKDYPLPALEPYLAEYERNLQRIADACRERGVRCVFVTQPTLWRADLPDDLLALLWSRPIGMTGRACSAGDLARGMQAYNDAMTGFCRRASVECIDLAARCPKEGTVFMDDEHFTEAGARLVAEVIAEYFLSHRDGMRRP